MLTTQLRHSGLSLESPEVLGEVLWERCAVDRGVQRYRSSLDRMKENGTLERVALADTEPGQIVTSSIVARLAPAIEAAQAEAVQHIATSGPRIQYWAMLILCLSADKIAYILARTVLATNTPKGRRPARDVALQSATAIRTQREFELWVEAENQHARTQTDGDSTRPNWARLMKALSPEVTDRAFKKWSKKSDLVVRLDWTLVQRLHFGMKLVGILVEALPDLFVLEAVPSGARGQYSTELTVLLTPHARDWIEQRHADNEMSRPWLSPMIAPPADWCRVEDPEAICAP